VRVPLDASMSPFQVLMQVEYAEFLRLTNLDRLRPDHDIRPSALGRYDEMWDHILVRQVELGELKGRDVPIEEAVEDWFDHIYSPIVRIARERGVLRRFPDRTEADIYIWTMAHRDDLMGRDNHSIGPEEAVSDLLHEIEESDSQQPLAPLRRIWQRVFNRSSGDRGN
jgi:hypothetical protein